MELEQKSCKFLKTNQSCDDYQAQGENKVSEEFAYINLELKDKLSAIAVKEGFLDYKIHTKRLPPDGNNFLGVLNEVTIKGTNRDGDKELELFVKSIIDDKESLTFIDLDHVYDLETHVYTHLSKILNELQEEAKVPLKERFNFVKCYDESGDGFLIMENMTKKGFGVWPRRDIVSLEYAEKTIEAIAKFHAFSFILQDKRPKYFMEHIRSRKFPINQNEDWKMFILNQCNNNLQYLDEYSRNKFEKYIPTIFDKLKKCYEPEPNMIPCLCHGDLKTGNILTRKVNEETEVILVDYQLIHYGLPYTDVAYFIFTATDREFRRKHLNYLKNHYYNYMEKFLKYFDLNIDDLLPRVEFERVYKEKLEFGLPVAAWLLPFIVGDEHDSTDLGTTTLAEIKSFKNKRVGIRFQEVVNDFIEWGYL